MFRAFTIGTTRFWHQLLLEICTPWQPWQSKWKLFLGYLLPANSTHFHERRTTLRIVQLLEVLNLKSNFPTTAQSQLKQTFEMSECNFYKDRRITLWHWISFEKFCIFCILNSCVLSLYSVVALLTWEDVDSVLCFLSNYADSSHSLENRILWSGTDKLFHIYSVPDRLNGMFLFFLSITFVFLALLKMHEKFCFQKPRNPAHNTPPLLFFL